MKKEQSYSHEYPAATHVIIPKQLEVEKRQHQYYFHDEDFDRLRTAAHAYKLTMMMRVRYPTTNGGSGYFGTRRIPDKKER
jgi:hypothetical protein